MTEVVVPGLGYVELPLATRAAEVVYDVAGYELDSRKVGCTVAGHSYAEDIGKHASGSPLTFARQPLSRVGCTRHVTIQDASPTRSK